MAKKAKKSVASSKAKKTLDAPEKIYIDVDYIGADGGPGHYPSEVMEAEGLQEGDQLYFEYQLQRRVKVTAAVVTLVEA